MAKRNNAAIELNAVAVQHALLRRLHKKNQSPKFQILFDGQPIEIKKKDAWLSKGAAKMALTSWMNQYLVWEIMDELYPNRYIDGHPDEAAFVEIYDHNTWEKVTNIVKAFMTEDRIRIIEVQ